MTRAAKLCWCALWLAAAVALAALTLPRSAPRETIHGLAAMTRGVLAGQDTITHDYPAFMWGWQEVLRSGRLPLWNPSWFCGQPFIASQTFMAFYPPNWLGLVLPMPLAFNIQYPIHLFLAAAVMAWVARRRGMGAWGAGVAGLAWGLGGHLATLVGPGHLQKVQALAWLPLVAWGFAEMIASRDPQARRRAAWAFAPGLAMQVLAGHLQVVYLSLAAGVLEGAARWICATCTRDAQIAIEARRFFSVRYWAPLVAALAMAAAISAVFWLPTIEFAGQSNREGAIAYEDAARGSIPPNEIFEWLELPRLLGDTMPHGRGAYAGKFGASATSHDERIISDYVGAGTALLALVALLSGAAPWRRALGFLALAAVALGVSLGQYGGLHRLAWRVLPGFAHFRSPATTMALFAHGMALAAGLGMDAMASRPGVAPRRFILIGAGLAAVAWAAVTLSITPGPPQRRIDLILTAARWTAGWGALAGAALAMAAFTGRVRNAALVCFVLLLGSDLVLNARPFWNAIEAGPYTSGYLKSHPAMDVWREGPQPVRHLEAGNELGNRALTLSDFSRGVEVATTMGYHPVVYGRYQAWLEGLGAYDPKFLRMWAVNYLLLSPDAKAPAGFQMLGDTGRGLLWLAQDFAYARALERVAVAPDFLSMPARMKAAQADGATAGFITPDAAERVTGTASLKDGAWAELNPGTFESSADPLGPGWMRVIARAQNPAWVVLAEPAVSGWRLWVNGAEQTPLQINGLQPAVLVPAGDSEILAAYDPPSLRLGLLVTYWAFFVLSLLAVRQARVAGEDMA